MMPARQVVAAALVLMASACAPGEPADEPEPAPAGGAEQPADEPSPGADAPEQDSEQDPDEVSILVQGFRFDPGSVRVAGGGIVTWRNEDAIGHTVTAGTPADPAGSFDLGMPEVGDSVSQTFTEPGTFVYFCRFHESMRGEVVVTG